MSKTVPAAPEDPEEEVDFQQLVLTWISRPSDDRRAFQSQFPLIDLALQNEACLGASEEVFHFGTNLRMIEQGIASLLEMSPAEWVSGQCEDRLCQAIQGDSVLLRAIGHCQELSSQQQHQVFLRAIRLLFRT